MRPGPRGEIPSCPFPGLDALPADGPRRVFAFLDLLHTRDGPVRLRPWQRRFITGLYRRPRPRQALLQVARQQGKSHVAALIGLYALIADRAQNPVIAIVANSERQAGELFAKAMDIVRHTPALEQCLGEYANRLVYEHGGTRLQVFASSPAGAMGGGGRQIRGISAHAVVVDELAFTPDASLWSSVLWPTILVDPDGIMLALTTPGYDQNGPAYKLYQRAKAGDTDRFYAQIHEADPDAAIDDRRQWRKANPSIGHGLTMEDLAVAFANRTSDATWSREHLGLWTQGEAQWIHRATWDALANPTRVAEPGTRIWAAFDGSWARDSTAIVASTKDGFLFVVGMWEKPAWDEGWKVPRGQVEDTVAEMFATYQVEELAMDPSYWERECLQWGEQYGEDRVIAFPPIKQRMAPAVTAFSGAVAESRLSHSGDERLARHITNAITRTSTFGDYISKAAPDSALKIDAAIAAVIAFHRAATRVRASVPTLALW